VAVADHERLNMTLLRTAGWYGPIPYEFGTEICGGKDIAAVFKHPAWSKFLNHHHKKSKTLPPLFGSVSAITATPDGLAHIGLSRDRGANTSQAALAQKLPVSWFCLADPNNPRELLSSEEASEALGCDELSNNVAFVVSPERFDQHIILRVYVSTTDVSQTIQQVRSIQEELLEDSALAQSLAAGKLGIAVLCETPEKVSSVRDAVHRRSGRREPLSEQFRIQVALGPSPETMADALKERRKRRAK
jgi:hypothetical protein